MNRTISELFERKSVRVFTDREITAEEKNVILEAAAMAPSAGNQQLYTIIDVTNQKEKEKLAVTCDNQPFIAEAKMVLVFCADCQKWYDAFLSSGCNPRHPGVGDLMLAVTDTAIAAQNAVTASWSLGIGSCYIGDIMENCEIHRELFGLPPYVFPAVMAVFGYPTKQQEERVKPRRVDLEHLVHENAYRRMDETELKGMFAEKGGNQTYDEWITAFCKRKYNSDFSREMSRSVAEYMKNFVKEE